MKITLILTVKGKEPLLLETIESARETAGKKIEIVVVFDGQKPELHHKELLPVINVVKSYKDSKGCQYARHIGTTAVKSGVMVFSDAHMKFSENWAVKLEEFYKNKDNGNVIGCAPCGHLDEKFNILLKPFKNGADIVLKSDWLDAEHPGEKIYRSLARRWGNYKPGEEIPCVLGAFYTMKYLWYKKIGQPWKTGTAWGRSEELLSIVNYLCGGTCRLLEDIRVWHVFRTPWRTSQYNEELWVNSMRLLWVLPLDKAEYNTLFNWCKMDRLPKGSSPDSLMCLLERDHKRKEVIELKEFLSGKRSEWLKYRREKIIILDGKDVSEVKEVKKVEKSKEVNKLDRKRDPKVELKKVLAKLLKKVPKNTSKVLVCDKCESYNTFEVFKIINGREYLRCTNCCARKVLINGELKDYVTID